MNYVKGTLTIIATSSIDSVSMGNQVDAYSLAGNKVLSKSNSLEGLSKGIYIVNGRKVVVN